MASGADAEEEDDAPGSGPMGRSGSARGGAGETAAGWVSFLIPATRPRISPKRGRGDVAMTLN
jgi:hypothetical protein